MQRLLIENLRLGFHANTSLALKLAETVDAADMCDQPAAAMNHPAWIFRHLHTYHPVIVDLLEGHDPTDPKDAPFGKNSEALADPAVYGEWSQVVADYRGGVESVNAALEGAVSMDESLLFRKMPVARWQERFPAAGSILAYLMVHHEAFHIGQLSTWRRARGLPRLG